MIVTDERKISNISHHEHRRESGSLSALALLFCRLCSSVITVFFLSLSLILGCPAGCPVLAASAASGDAVAVSGDDISFEEAASYMPKYHDKPVITGTFSFPSISLPGDVSGRFFYSDGYFTEPANVYDAKLSSMSLCFACASMASSDAKRITYKNKSKNARHLLDRTGFKDICVNADFVHKPGEDTIGVVMGRKTIECPDGEYTLVAIGIRGAGYENEWVGNMKIGAAGDAEGFHNAAMRAKDAVAAYIKRYAIDTGRTKLWIAGFSRAGAVTDLLTRELTNAYDASGTRVYGYSFAAPRGAYKRSKSYPNSHCVVGSSDAVPLVAPEFMGFTHYGDEHPIGGYIEGFQSYRMVVELAFNFIVTVPGEIRFEKTDVIPSQEEFIKRLIEAIQYAVVSDRSAYIGRAIEDGQTAEQIFSFLLRFLMTADESLMKDIADAVKDATKNIDGDLITTSTLMRDAVKDGIDSLDEEDKNAIYSSLWGCFKPAFIKTVSRSDLETIKTMWRSLMHILFDIANYDYIHSGETGFDLIGTLINNIASIGQAHTPEKYLDLVTSQDGNYTGVAWEAGASSSAVVLRIENYDKTDVMVSEASDRSGAGINSLPDDSIYNDGKSSRTVGPLAIIRAGRTAGSRDPGIYMGRVSDDGSDLKGDTAGVLYLQATAESERALYADEAGSYDISLMAAASDGEKVFDSWVDEKGVALTHETTYVLHISSGRSDHKTVRPVYKKPVMADRIIEGSEEESAIEGVAEDKTHDAVEGGSSDVDESSSGAALIILTVGAVLALGGAGGYIYIRKKRLRRR